jgi:hypothetical protein
MATLKEQVYCLHKKYGLQYPLYNFLAGFEYRFLIDKGFIKKSSFEDLSTEDINLIKKDIDMDALVRVIDNNMPKEPLKPFMVGDTVYEGNITFINKHNKFIEAKVETNVEIDEVTQELEKYIYDRIARAYPRWRFYIDTLMIFNKLLKYINFTDYTLIKARGEDLEGAISLYYKYNACNMIIDLISFLAEEEFINANKFEEEVKAMGISPFTSNLAIDMNIDFFKKEILGYKFLGTQKQEEKCWN